MTCMLNLQYSTTDIVSLIIHLLISCKSAWKSVIRVCLHSCYMIWLKFIEYDNFCTKFFLEIHNLACYFYYHILYIGIVSVFVNFSAKIKERKVCLPFYMSDYFPVYEPEGKNLCIWNLNASGDHDVHKNDWKISSSIYEYVYDIKMLQWSRNVAMWNVFSKMLK